MFETVIDTPTEYLQNVKYDALIIRSGSRTSSSRIFMHVIYQHIRNLASRSRNELEEVNEYDMFSELE